MINTIVTKWDIVRALEIEPLTVGFWVNENTCAVCAVGAVMRSAGVADSALGGVCSYATNGHFAWGNGEDDFRDTALPGNYLSALSIVWEYLNANNAATCEELRPDIVRWAIDNIPDGYRVEVRA